VLEALPKPRRRADARARRQLRGSTSLEAKDVSLREIGSNTLLVANLNSAYSVAPPVPKSFPHDPTGGFFYHHGRRLIVDRRWWRIDGAARQCATDQRSPDETASNSSRDLAVLCAGNRRVRKERTS
jgi:hypothetical protein